MGGCLQCSQSSRVKPRGSLRRLAARAGAITKSTSSQSHLHYREVETADIYEEAADEEKTADKAWGRSRGCSYTRQCQEVRYVEHAELNCDAV